MSSSRHPIREKLEWLAVRAGFAILPRLPRPWIVALSRGLGRLALMVSPKLRRIAEANLEVVFGTECPTEERNRILRRSYQSFALMLLDTFWFSRDTRERMETWVDLAPDVNGIYEAGPRVCLTLHLGNWEVLGMGLPNVPVTGLCLHNPTRKLVAATYGRSMYAIQLDESVAVGEPEWNVEGMEVFPNPASEVANIRFQMRGEAAAEILLFDNNGRLVERAFQGRLGQGTHNFEVALSGLPAGIYVGQVKAGRRVFSRTLLKK